ncbi:lytic polysaccharide monooxygenase [Plenodomus tracheiphilus IPT5]|uniref:Lytic polysaccharide monooxygenase n=1 Tax=Plenodomus tracheiphilus IPT5 TaxID=1408161 RepID=A0A6A7BMY4_9PLEO|nr:lytic polysaccharide monooxygenase [Plenodomus tracheiphilus IPT5]
MSLRSIVTVTSVLAAGVNAHMIMSSPVPYSVDKIDSGPITQAQYPCKSNLGYTVSTMNQMAVGTKQSLTFKGSAVHGGGSCQLSVTTDTEPTKDSVFKVIKSMEGACPGVDGPEAFEFELPDSIPNGKATFAWTWFAKLSGGPEMYMNCAPIEVSGGASDKSKFEALPDMLIANIASTSCKSQTSKALKFPNPGSSVQVASESADVVDPTGDCGSSGTLPANPSEPSGSASAEPSPAPSSAAPPSGTGAPAAPAVPTTPSTPSPPSTPSEGGSSGTCTTDGAVVCNGTTQFGLCNGGKVVWQAVASGTTCTNGVIAKRGYNGRIARPRYNSPRIALGN